MATIRLTEQPFCFYIFSVTYLIVKFVSCEEFVRSEAANNLDYYFNFNILLYDVDDCDERFGLDNDYSAVLTGLWLISRDDDYLFQ